jgi:hypothetical protein
MKDLSTSEKLQIALHINKSNLEHIDYLENKINELEAKLTKQTYDIRKRIKGRKTHES